MREENKVLIRKSIAGKCTAEERQQFGILMQQPGSSELFDEVLNENWEEFKNDKPASAAFIQNFRDRFNKKLPKAEPQYVSITKHYHFFRYAAILTFFVLGAAVYSVWKFEKKSGSTAIAMLSSHNPNGQRSTIILPDSSMITLGAGSSIHYPERFANNTREVSLEGEAFFEVKKNKHQPFIIHTGEVQTKVLGTSFKVDAFKGRDVTVAVATGKVRVDRKVNSGTKMQSLAVLLPGDEMEWKQSSGKTIISHTMVEEITGWKQGKLTFSGTSLAKMAEILERWYSVKIEIPNKEIRKYKMNLVLDGNQSIVQSLELLKATIKTNYTIEGKTIIIN